ncbi:subtilisin-like protease SBT1.7 [Panicum miliaceum]|uniref:Subtilisin-like protease SBT1.7 n=1 Tax=Panicum miliaceum TaxID=4540 RepID=A0A3L6PLZ5_PANMI|nr:subtilisin-like protease SBT1.7 [Panicum miliaceum]
MARGDARVAEKYTFGFIVWSDGEHKVTSPIAITWPGRSQMQSDAACDCETWDRETMLDRQGAGLRPRFVDGGAPPLVARRLVAGSVLLPLAASALTPGRPRCSLAPAARTA